MYTLWSDRKRHLGMPISSTKYMLTNDRVIIQTGFLNTAEEEINLYRIMDIGLTRSFMQRIFKVGTIRLTSSDKTMPHCFIVNVVDSRDVKELIYSVVEEAKKKRRVRSTELVDDFGDADTGDFDGLEH